jgi:tektin-1
MGNILVFNYNVVINCTVCQQAQASLRNLLTTQIQLEEDINIKANTLKIEEVDCMALRESMHYYSY